MGIKVSWDEIDNKILRFDYDDRWGWDDVAANGQRGVQMINEAGIEHPDMMLVFKSSWFPVNVLANDREAASYIPDSTRTMAIVGANVVVRGIAGIFKRVFPKKGSIILFASSEEDARRIIRQRRQDAESKAETK